MLSSSLWLTSLSMTVSRSIHGATNGITSFFLMSEYYFIEMATHSSLPAWSIPWTEEPGGLQSMGSQRVGHDRSDLAHCFIVIWSSDFDFRICKRERR